MNKYRTHTCGELTKLDKEKETFPLPRAITWDAECQRAMAHCNFLTKVKTRKIRGVDNKDAKKKSILKITMDGFDTYNYQHSILFIHQLCMMNSSRS